MDRRAFLRGTGGLGLLAALAGCAPSYPPPRLTIATGPPGGIYDRIGTALAAAWDDELHPAGPSVPRSTAGSVENMARLSKGEVTAAISQLDVAAETVKKDPASLRALARIYDDVVHVVVPQDSPIRSLTQLRGRTVSVGADGSGVFFLAQRVLQAIGLSVTANLRPVPYSINKSAAALQAGEIEAFFWVGGLGTPQIVTLAKQFRIRLLDITDDVLKQVQAASSYYTPGTVAANTYQGITEPVNTLLVRNVLLVRAEMPEALAHDLVKTLFTRQDQIAKATATALTIDPRRAIGTVPVPLHPGAERWFREAREEG